MLETRWHDLEAVLCWRGAVSGDTIYVISSCVQVKTSHLKPLLTINRLDTKASIGDYRDAKSQIGLLSRLLVRD